METTIASSTLPPATVSAVFARNIQALRIRMGISQQQMANELGVKRSTYSAWETGASEPGLACLEKIQTLHAVGIDVLMRSTLYAFTDQQLAQVRKAIAPRPVVKDR